MSILDAFPGGSILSKPVRTNTLCTETAEALTQRILDGLLPKQKEFVEDTGHTIVGYVGGFGAGKTRGLCAGTALLAIQNPNTVGAVFEPTNTMIRDVWVRSFSAFLDEYDFRYSFRSTPQPEYDIHVPGGRTVILCRATETWNRVRGQTLSFIGVDEFDTSPMPIAQKAMEMMIGRIRGAPHPRILIGTTPEGYRITHQLFVQDFIDARDSPERLASLTANRRLVQASTYDNPYLPEGFIDQLMEMYPPQLVRSYIHGEFTNLENATVYSYFDRDRHWTDREARETDHLYAAVDFNIGACFCEILVRQDDRFYVVAEHHPKDTPHIIRAFKQHYQQWIDDDLFTVIPDASSRHRATTNSSESDLAMFKRAGIRVKEQLSNPPIEDRVNAINSLLMNDLLFINPKARYLTRYLEQQAYGKDGKPEKREGGGLKDPSGPTDALGYGIYRLAPIRKWSTGSGSIRLW